MGCGATWMRHSGIQKDISLDSSLAGAYYNIALGYVKKDERDAACD